MKRVSIILIAAASLLTGCAPRIDAADAMPSDAQRLALQSVEAKQTETPDLRIPSQRYIQQLSGADGNVTVHVDAAVVALAERYPVVSVTGGTFSQDQATGVFAALMAGKDATVTIGKDVQTKAEIAAQLEKLRQELADGSYKSYGYTREEWEQTIAVLEGYHENAPKENKSRKLPADGMLRRMGAGENQYEQMEAFVQGGETLSMISWDDQNGDRSHCYYHSRRDADRPYTMRDAIAYTPGSQLPDAAQGKLSISCADAQALCDAVLTAAGVEASPAAVYIVGDRKDGYTDGEVAPAKHYAYQFFYARQYAGIPVATTVWESGSDWDYEKITFIVDDEGIVRMEWFSPLSIGQRLRENVALLPFPQIAEIFEKMIPISYEPQINRVYQNDKIEKRTISIRIDAVQLGLLRIADMAESPAQKGVLTPAWVFMGDIENETRWRDGRVDHAYQGPSGASGSDFYTGPTIVFAINAIDGSVIDVAEGY